LGTSSRSVKRAAPAESLADALFSSSQQRVLALLFGQPDRSFYSAEIIRMAASGSGAVQRELARLEQSGLITAQRVGRQKHFRANRNSPLFGELEGIVRKTVGLAVPLGTALRKLAPRIIAAFVYGSVAKKKDTARSDIDLLIVSDDVTYADVFVALEPHRPKLHREINATVYTRAEVHRRLKEGNAFIKRVIAQPKLWIIGSERDLRA
jgi:predicted nucleotidyltransferase